MNSNIDALRKKMMHSVKEKVKEKYSGREAHIIRAVNALQDLDAVFNLLSEHLHEWYAYHFPELDSAVRDPEAYLKLVYNLGQRKNFSEKSIIEIYPQKEAAAKIIKAAQNSIGSEIEETDLAEIKLLALNALNLKEERMFLFKFIEKSMNEELPNFTALAGALVGARLLAKAGSKKKLMLMPSSTLQVLGAEKALFQHLKKKGKPPKHGYLFQNTLVQSVNRNARGKIARSLAAKLAIAVKADYFGGEKTLGEKLRKGLEQRAASLK
ncbi:MAG: hypothetical protein V1494_06150 [Candidatus Diapherotrites archaeon]